jgi:hypothetical protein
MASFVQALQDAKMGHPNDQKHLHQWLFGSYRILRRGRYWWRIGMLRQTLINRKERGLNEGQNAPFSRLLTTYEGLFRVRRAKRLWYYFFDSLRYNGSQTTAVLRRCVCVHVCMYVCLRVCVSPTLLHLHTH